MDKKNNSILIVLCSVILLALLGVAIWLAVAKPIPIPLVARIAIVLALFLLNAVTFILFQNRSSKRKATTESDRPALGLISQIQTSLDNLVLKTNALPEKNFAEKKRIETLDESVNLMNPVATIDAAKLEQEILMNVTQISSLCDSVIAGSDDATFKKALAILENQIRERDLKEKR